MKSIFQIFRFVLRKLALVISLPLLRYQGYQRLSLNLGLPESHYFQGEDSLGSLNQIHKRYLKETGWVESKNANQSVRGGKYLPWTSYAFTHWIEKKNYETSSILEFGSGASTLYWATKFSKVFSVESDLEWLKKVQSVTAPFPNVEIYSLFGNHFNSQSNQSIFRYHNIFFHDLELFPELNFNYEQINFNLIQQLIEKSNVFFVDGGPRNLYMYLLAEYVDDNAVIFVDNSDQLYTYEGRTSLTIRGFKEIEFNSLGPLNHSATSTSVFIRDFRSL
jgi:hypothetical protein